MADQPKKKPVGRPSKLTDDVREKILKAIRGGNFRGASAEWAGVSATTMRHWMAFGREKPKSKLGKFRTAVLEAERAAEITSVALIRSAATKDWKAAAYWLDRKRKKSWGKPAPQRHQHEGGDPAKPIAVAGLADLLTPQPGDDEVAPISDAEVKGASD